MLQFSSRSNYNNYDQNDTDSGHVPIKVEGKFSLETHEMVLNIGREPLSDFLFVYCVILHKLALNTKHKSLV